MFLFYLLYLIVSPLVKTNFLDSAHSIWSTVVLERVRRGGFICWFILDFDICKKQEVFFKVANHTSNQFYPSHLQIYRLPGFVHLIGLWRRYSFTNAIEVILLLKYVALRKSVWSSSHSLVPFASCLQPFACNLTCGLCSAKDAIRYLHLLYASMKWFWQG